MPRLAVLGLVEPVPSPVQIAGKTISEQDLEFWTDSCASFATLLRLMCFFCVSQDR